MTERKPQQRHPGDTSHLSHLRGEDFTDENGVYDFEAASYAVWKAREAAGLNYQPRRQPAKEEPDNIGMGNRKREREAYVILGPPGAGKSSAVANRLVAEHGALKIDWYLAAECLPEFMDGINAQGVHLESVDIVDAVLKRAMENGDNVVLPRVGSETGYVQELLDKLKEAGYTTELYLVDLDPELAADRVVTRFLETGLFVDPAYVLNRVGTKPRESFEELKGHPAVARFTWLDQDVPFGQPPNVVEEGENDPEGASRLFVPEGSPDG